jgi:hypothetical protein
MTFDERLSNGSVSAFPDLKMMAEGSELEIKSTQRIFTETAENCFQPFLMLP